jgi:hypothetical protein
VDAALKARDLDRSYLLSKNKTPQNKDEDDIFFISTYHPHDQSMRKMLHQNWAFLGKSQTTDFLHKKHLMCGYRRPKNLRDMLMRANIPAKVGDEQADPNHLLLSTIDEAQEEPKIEIGTPANSIRQKSILDFFKPTTSGATIDNSESDTTPIVIDNTLSNTPVTHLKKTPNPGPSKFRGFNFCNRRDCRYCPLLNKSGKITCLITGLEHNCMKNISCRSSNLIYAITCTRCGKQYVGQTMLRLKDRFVHHFRDINISDQEKTVSKHFSQTIHDGIKDVSISVLEFIKKTPRSHQAATICITC